MHKDDRFVYFGPIRGGTRTDMDDIIIALPTLGLASVHRLHNEPLAGLLLRFLLCCGLARLAALLSTQLRFSTASLPLASFQLDLLSVPVPISTFPPTG
jgi:hypothetical protein